ncbi:hypothetical protein [Sinorhizobium fredii]|uniref:hypothetical protein n=1 Tax=Rhizobium fredii TaxID=380 RepID=UPI0035173681
MNLLLHFADRIASLILVERDDLKGLQMASFLEYAKKYEVKENEAVVAFLSVLGRQKEAFEKGEFNRRSWVKKDGAGFSVKLGKIEKSYFLPKKEDVITFLDLAASGAREDEDFIPLIEAAYAKPAETPKPRRGRKPKGGEVGNG